LTQFEKYYTNQPTWIIGNIKQRNIIQTIENIELKTANKK